MWATVGVEDAGHADLHVVHALVVEAERLGNPLACRET